MVHPVVPTSAALPDSHHHQHDSEDEHDKYDVDGGSLDGHEDESTKEKSSKRKRLRGLRRRGDTGTSAEGGKGRGRADTSESNGGAGGGGTASTGSPRGGTPRTERKVHPTTVDTCPTLKGLKEVCMDSIFPSAPEKIYNLMFTSGFMKDFWNDNQKLLGQSHSHFGAPLVPH